MRVNNTLSPFKACTLGVPQGSILGPLLFSIYINDLPSMCDDVGIIMYADDTVIYTHGKSATEVAKKCKRLLSGYKTHASP